MSQVKATEIEGDVAIGRHVTAGGDAKVQGNCTVKKGLRVEGWLDAPNIKHPCKGMFRTKDELVETYPEPHNGWWALVGNFLPAPIYVAYGEEWIDTGEVGGNPSVEFEESNEMIAEIYETVVNLRESIGQPDGLAPLDGSGKVSSQYLPSYVDDVVEFDGFESLPYGFLGCFDEIPEEYADYTTDGTGNYQLQIGTNGVYSDSNKFYAGQIVAVYSGHTQTASFFLNDPNVDREAYGIVSEDGNYMTPVKGKIYVDVSTRKLYRWSGTMLTFLAQPLSLGEQNGEAFSGSAGAQLRSQLQTLQSKYSSFVYRVTDMMNGWDCFNINGYAAYPDTFTLEEALEWVTYVCQTDFWQPSVGFEIKFLSESGWVYYRYKIEYNKTTVEDDVLDPDNWELVVEGGGSGSSGTVSDPQLQAQVTQLKSKVDELRLSYGDFSSNVGNLLFGFDSWNATAAYGEDTPLSFEEAVGLLADLAPLALPSIGFEMKYLSESGWKKYRYKNFFIPGQTEQEMQDPDNWEEVVDNTQGGSSNVSESSDKITFYEMKTGGSDSSGWTVRGSAPDGFTYVGVPQNSNPKYNLRVLGNDIQINLPNYGTQITDGQIIRILSTKEPNTSTTPKIRIAAPTDSNTNIYGLGAKANANYWDFSGGCYIELVCVSNPDKNGGYPCNYVVRTLTKFSS